jgi:hypothetical protein
LSELESMTNGTIPLRHGKAEEAGMAAKRHKSRKAKSPSGAFCASLRPSSDQVDDLPLLCVSRRLRDFASEKLSATRA